MDDRPLQFFVENFYKIWRAGNDARLIIECKAGNASVSLHHHVSQPPPPLKPSKPRRAGPSRIRRRAKRAMARAAAENVAFTANISVQTDSVHYTSEVAEKATEAVPVKTQDVAVQADHPHQLVGHIHQTVVQTAQPTPTDEKAVQVLPDLDQTDLQKHHQAQLTQPFPILNDELCPDQDYVVPAHAGQCEPPRHHLFDHRDQRGVVPNHNIPQLDGHDAEEVHLAPHPRSLQVHRMHPYIIEAAKMLYGKPPW